MFSDFPSLHPLVVHFPIVLILLAAAFQAVALWKPQWVQVRWAALVIMGGGFVGSLLSSTLFHAMISADAPKEARVIFEAHEQYAQYTLWLSGITLLLKGIGVFFKLTRRSYESIVLVSATVAAIFLSIAGHHGARLTHIAGVGPMGKYLMKGHGADGHDENDMDGMDMKGDSAVHGHDSMPDMQNMPGMDSMKGMENMKDMEDMNEMKNKGNNMDNMKGMNGMKDMKGMGNMPGMNNKSNNMNKMKGMDNMQGMDKMKDMKGMDKMNNKDMNEMKDMKGMDNMKDMNDMKSMPGMDTAKGMNNMPGMKGMENMKGMPGMNNMKGAKLIDPSKPYDNNPSREKKAAEENNG